MGRGEEGRERERDGQEPLHLIALKCVSQCLRSAWLLTIMEMVAISSPVPGRLQFVLKCLTDNTFIDAGDTQADVCRSTVRCVLSSQKERK